MSIDLFGATWYVVGQATLSLRLGVQVERGDGAHLVSALELAPTIGMVQESGLGPSVGMYLSTHRVRTEGRDFGVGARAGGLWFSTGCPEYRLGSLEASVGRSWSSEGAAWEIGGVGSFLAADLEVLWRPDPGPDAPDALRADLGLALPLKPPCIDGRPLRVGARALLPAVALAADPRQDPELVRWLRRAREEHASITTFLRLAQELSRLGAPRALVGACLDAAREEHHHAALCFGQVAARAGAAPRVRPLAARPRTWEHRSDALTELAVESWADGVVGEATAARQALDARDASRDAGLADLEDRIAQDESGHARLSERILSWGVAEGGARVRRALREAERAPG